MHIKQDVENGTNPKTSKMNDGEYHYSLPFTLHDEVSDFNRSQQWLSEESERRLTWLSSHTKPYITIDGTKEIDDHISSLRWVLDDTKSGHVDIVMDRELINTELDKLPFCLTDRTHNLMVEHNWRFHEPMSAEFEKNAALESVEPQYLTLTDEDLKCLEQTGNSLEQ